MLFKTYFAMSAGLSQPIVVPRGTLASIADRVSKTETVLGLTVERFENNPQHWTSTVPWSRVSDKVYCEVVEAHNAFVVSLYEQFSRYATTPCPDGETITPEQVAPYWHGLHTIEVPVQRWSEEYYTSRMQAMYEALRGRGDRYVIEGTPLTAEQASEVIGLFSPWLDRWCCDLECPGDGDLLERREDHIHEEGD